MRPKLKLLEDSLVERIVEEARDVLCTVGVEIHNPAVLETLSGHGARVDRGSAKAWLTPEILDTVLSSAPAGFQLYDVERRADPPSGR